jgi:hypothetical protein
MTVRVAARRLGLSGEFFEELFFLKKCGTLTLVSQRLRSLYPIRYFTGRLGLLFNAGQNGWTRCQECGIRSKDVAAASKVSRVPN